MADQGPSVSSLRVEQRLLAAPPGTCAGSTEASRGRCCIKRPHRRATANLAAMVPGRLFSIGLEMDAGGFSSLAAAKFGSSQQIFLCCLLPAP